MIPSFFKKKTIASVPTKVRHTRNLALNTSALPIMEPTELLEYVGYDPKLTSLFRKIGVSQAHFDVLFKDPIYAFAKAAQLAPASENNHHSSPGGLLIHTLEVIENALLIRRGYQLPLGGSPEEISAQAHVWTYGVFVSCLLHDIGKLFQRIQIVLNLKNGRQRALPPFGIDISKTEADSYFIRFNDVPYKSHQRLSLTCFSEFIPRSAREWLSENPEVFNQVIHYLWGDEYDSQIIGDIAIRADRKSTADDLDITNPDVRFPGAGDSLADKMINRMRQMLDEKLIRYNQDGGMAWIAGEHTYFVCRALAEALIKSFDETGTGGIPSDPIRVYTILQEHGFAQANTENGAVFKISIEEADGKYSHVFTCLKFKTRKLFRAVRLPDAFNGSIREIVTENKSRPQEKKAAAEPSPRMPDKTPETVTEPKVVTPEPEAVPEKNEPVSPSETEDDPFAQPVAQNVPTTEKEPVAEEQIEAFNDEPVAAKKSIETETDTSQKTPQKPMGPDSDIKSLDWEDDVGDAFITWVKNGILNKTISVNNAKACLHFVEEGIFLVSPKIFQHFVKTSKLGDGSEHVKLQKRFARMKLNIKTRLTNYNVHAYIVDTGNRTARLNGWLLPYSLVFAESDERPQPNKFIRPSDD